MSTEKDTYVIEFKGQDAGFASMLDRILKALESTESQLKDTGKAAEETGDALATEGKKAAGAADGTKKLSTAKKALNTIMQGALLSIGAQIADLSKLTGVLKAAAAAALEYSKAGSQQSALDAGLAAAYQTIGISAEEATAATAKLNAQIGTLTQGFGAIAGDEKLIQTMTNYTIATRDAEGAQAALENMLKISRVTGKDITQIQEQYTLAIKGGTEPLMKYGGLTKTQAERIAKMKDETKKAAEVNKIMTERFKDVSLAGNDAESAIARFNNAVGGDLDQAVGQAINNTGFFQAVLGPFTEQFEKLQGWVKENTATIKTWAMTVAQGVEILTRVTGEFAVIAVQLFYELRILITGLQLGFAEMANGVKVAFNAITDAIVPAIKTVLSSVESLARAAGLDGFAEDMRLAGEGIKDALTIDTSEGQQEIKDLEQEIKDLEAASKEAQDATQGVFDTIADGLGQGRGAAMVSNTTQESEQKKNRSRRPRTPEAPAPTTPDAGPTQTDAERAALSEKLIADQQKLIGEYYKEEAVKMRIAILEGQLTGEAKAQEEAALRRFEIENNLDLSPLERKLALLESDKQLQEDLARVTQERQKQEAEGLKRTIELEKQRKEVQQAVADASLASLDVLGQATKLAIEDKKKQAKVDGAIEAVRAGVNIALGIAGDPTKFAAAAKHALNAVAFFKIAGGGGGASGGGGGSGGTTTPSNSGAVGIDVNKAQRDNAKAIAEAIAGSTNASNTREITVNLNSPTVVGTPEGARTFIKLIEPEMRRTLEQVRR